MFVVDSSDVYLGLGERSEVQQGNPKNPPPVQATRP